MDHSAASEYTEQLNIKLKHYVDGLPHTDFNVLYFHRAHRLFLAKIRSRGAHTFLSLCVSHKHRRETKKKQDDMYLIGWLL